MEDGTAAGVEIDVDDGVEITDCSSSDACCSFCKESIAEAKFSEEPASNVEVFWDALDIEFNLLFRVPPRLDVAIVESLVLLVLFDFSVVEVPLDRLTLLTILTTLLFLETDFLLVLLEDPLTIFNWEAGDLLLVALLGCSDSDDEDEAEKRRQGCLQGWSVLLRASDGTWERYIGCCRVENGIRRALEPPSIRSGMNEYFFMIHMWNGRELRRW